MNPAIHAAIMAAQNAEKHQKLQEEEERMTRYSPEDLETDWEFKIIRSSTPIFRKPDMLQQIRAEEALAGWQLLEKLDDTHVRFKRPANAAKRDEMLPEGVDPYRTEIGGAGIRPVLVLSIGVALLLALLAFLISTRTAPGDPVPLTANLINSMIVFFLILLPMILGIFLLLKNRR